MTLEATALPDLPPTTRSFNNNSTELTVTATHVRAYADLASVVVGRIAAPDAWALSLAGCAEFGAVCERGVIDALSLKLYRAPAHAAELAALVGIFAIGAAEGMTFEESVPYVAEAMLQSPRFLYRVEHEVGDGRSRALDPFELASRLSYAIWGSAPDQMLLDDAASGSLTTDGEIGAQIERMLFDPRGTEAALIFLSDWFDMHRLETFVPSGEEFPNFDVALLPHMRAETEASFRHVVEQSLPLTSIFDLQQTTVSRELAEYYGFALPQEGTATYDLTQVPERGGILTQAALHSIGGNEASTVRRGLFFLYQVLCGTMAPPPEGIDTTPPELEPGKSIRDVSADRVDTPSCGGCHQQFEPLVWGLVPFDATGAYNTVDHLGNALPEDGYVVFPGDGERVDYTSVAGLMSALGESERVRDCATLRSFEYVMGRSVSAFDSCSLDRARDSLVTGGASYAEIIRGLLLSDNFRNIQTEVL